MRNPKILVLERDPDLVRDDVLDELVSADAARTEYGVVLRGSVDDLDLEVDHDATKKLRAERGDRASASSPGVDGCGAQPHHGR